MQGGRRGHAHQEKDAEQDREENETEEDENTGMLHLIWNFYEHFSGSVGQLYACKEYFRMLNILIFCIR